MSIVPFPYSGKKRGVILRRRSGAITTIFWRCLEILLRLGRVSEGSMLTRAAHFGRLVVNRVSSLPHLNGELPERCFAGPDFLSHAQWQPAVVPALLPRRRRLQHACRTERCSRDGSGMFGDECMVDDVPEAGAKLRSRLGFSDRSNPTASDDQQCQARQAILSQATAVER